jgi:YYY domain-containing protein
MIWQALAWYAVVAVAGIVTTGALRRLGVGSGAGWAVARVAGWTLQAYVAWIAGWLGLTHWWWIGVAVLIPIAWWGWRGLLEVKPKALVEAELVGLGAFSLLAFLRLSAMAVTATEKPMDLAILATLLRPGTIPPVDPWLAGQSIPYYYFGFVPWLLPAKLLGFAPDVVFNLLLPTLAAVSAQGAWALARAVGGSRRTGVMAAFLVVFAGTFDGWRQLFAGTPLSGLDLWPSSRAIQGTITEFPLFTFHLGDLHPHLLCLPFVLVAIFLGRVLGTVKGRWLLTVVLCAVLFGAAAASNPWCAIPLGLAILLAAVGDEAGFVRPVGPGLRQWARVAVLGVGGWVLFLPFWLNFHPPAEGFGWVTSGTRVDEMLLFLGGVLVPPVLVTWELSWRWGGVDLARRQFSRAVWLAGLVLLAILSRRPLLALALGVGTVLTVTVWRGKFRRARPVFALTLVPLALLVFMELLYFKDPYGAEFYRMNTVFKASHLAFSLLAVVAPVLLGWLRRRRAVLAYAGAVLVLLAGLPQFLTLGGRALASPVAGWDGLGWMASGEPAAAAWLRQRRPGSVLVEGVGDAYSDAARISSASGIPAVLGWENHEGVWRGGSIGQETDRRKAEIERLYKCGDPGEAKRIAQKLGASFIVVGSVERRLYPEAGLDAVVRSGKVVFRAGECVVISVQE